MWSGNNCKPITDKTGTVFCQQGRAGSCQYMIHISGVVGTTWKWSWSRVKLVLKVLIKAEINETKLRNFKLIYWQFSYYFGSYINVFRKNISFIVSDLRFYEVSSINEWKSWHIHMEGSKYFQSLERLNVSKVYLYTEDTWSSKKEPPVFLSNRTEKWENVSCLIKYFAFKVDFLPRLHKVNKVWLGHILLSFQKYILT